MHRSDPKAGEGFVRERAAGEAKSDREDSSGHSSEEEDTDYVSGDAEAWEESSSGDDEAKSTPVASRTRARSDSDNEPPRVVKRPNLGRPGCSGDSRQVPFGHGDQVGSGADTPPPTMNRLDPRAIYARQVAEARAAMQEVEGARGQGGTGHASEDSDEQGSDEGSQYADDNDTGDEADDEGATEDAEEPDEEGAAGDASGEQDTGDGDGDESSESGEESSQEAEGSLYTPSESDPSGSNSDI
jgi:hypothetical protein